MCASSPRIRTRAATGPMASCHRPLLLQTASRMHQADEVANDLSRTEALASQSPRGSSDRRNRDRYGRQRPDRSSAATPGPANARGLNGSIGDPSGIGNAPKVPAIPPPAIRPVPVPTLSPPAAYRTFPVQRAVKMERTRFAKSRSRRSASRAAVREQARLLDRKITSICREC
jgi:hypothetical protein